MLLISKEYSRHFCREIANEKKPFKEKKHVYLIILDQTKLSMVNLVNQAFLAFLDEGLLKLTIIVLLSQIFGKYSVFNINIELSF